MHPERDRGGGVVRSSTDHSVPSIEWVGPAGFERFASTGRFAVAEPRRFRAVLRGVVIDGVHVGEWTTSPISGSPSPRQDGASAVLVAVLDGVLRYWSNGRITDGRAGSLHVLSTTDPIRIALPEPARLLRVIVPAAFLPQRLRAATSSTVGEVPATRVTAGLLSLVEEVLDPAAGGSASPAARAVRAVAVAALEDSVPEGLDRDLRARILEHIERHLDDPDLSPQTIAAAFGISLRWVHAVFNVDGASVARHIRERRLELVAARLQREQRFPRISTLAEQSGFGARDQLARAFKARYGMTIADYAEQASRGRAPAPVDGRRERTA
jgi:AraC-like DNA-binding protein